MKKFLRTASVLLALIMVFSSISLVSAFAAECEEYYLDDDALYGDTDGDLKITVKDATAVQKHLAKLTELERKQQFIADVDGNGKLSISDATDIQKYLANIIYCFEAAPTEYCEADGEAVRVEVEFGEFKNITVKIPKAGYYCFESRRVSGGDCSFEIYDGVTNLEYGYMQSYLYLTAGRYTVKLESSWESQKDVADFSVNSANDEMPFDLNAAEELKAGDRIEVKSGAGTLVYKLEPEKLPNPIEGLAFYTQGENVSLDIQLYNEYLSPVGHGYNSYEDASRESGLLLKQRYAVITLQEDCSDFTLCCDAYLDYIDTKSEEIQLDKANTVELEEYFYPEYPDKCVYRAFSYYKFTPAESGYYKLTYVTQAGVELFGASPYYNDEPDEIRFNRYLYGEEIPYAVEYLNAGTTYYIMRSVLDVENKSSAECTLTKSTEQEYSAWYDEFNQTEEFTEPEHTVISLGAQEFASIGCVYIKEYDYGYYEGETKTFKFTADKDMTVVAYSEDSCDAYVYVMDSDGDYIGYGDDSGDFSSDFTVVVDLKAGETCYFMVSSTECYDFDDYFYFSVADINDYVPIS